jgi:hypothetical protein
MTSTTMQQSAAPSRRRTGARRAPAQPGPFPVVVVHPATVQLPGYLRWHRPRQRAANRLAAHLTDRCRAAVQPRHGLDEGVGVDLDNPRDPLMHLVGQQVVHRIIRQARELAAAPRPGTVRIGRDSRARPIVAVLHGPRWSLVLHRAHPYPGAWTYLGADDGYSLHFHGAGNLSVAWDEMTHDVYTTLTGDPG